MLRANRFWHINNKEGIVNLENMPVRLNEPYPEIEGAVDDRNTVRILKNLASSSESELTASMQYMYQYVVSDSVMPDVAKTLEEISIVEMTHLEMLMHAMTEFGGDPTYTDARGNYFSTSSIFYSKKLKEFLDANIEGEKMAIEAYKNAIRAVQNESLKQLFARIIKDEELHIKIFKHIRENVQFLSL